MFRLAVLINLGMTVLSKLTFHKA